MNIELFHFQTIEELYSEGYANVPNENGIYVILVPDNFQIVFTESTTAILEFRKRCMVYSASELQLKFEKSDKNILYIGKAEGTQNKLRQRIRQFVKYGYREADNHRGGRAIWQIENNKKLLLGYQECQNARAVESDELMLYYSKYGTFPVANRQR